MTDESVWKILDTTTGEWWNSSSNRIWLNRAAAKGAFNKSRLRYDPPFNDQSRYVLKEFKLIPVEESD